MRNSAETFIAYCCLVMLIISIIAYKISPMFVKLTYVDEAKARRKYLQKRKRKAIRKRILAQTRIGQMLIRRR